MLVNFHRQNCFAWAMTLLNQSVSAFPVLFSSIKLSIIDSGESGKLIKKNRLINRNYDFLLEVKLPYKPPLGLS